MSERCGVTGSTGRCVKDNAHEGLHQFQDIAKAARLAALEECAAICEQLAYEENAKIRGGMSITDAALASGYVLAALESERQIRALITAEEGKG